VSPPARRLQSGRSSGSSGSSRPLPVAPLRTPAADLPMI